MKKALILLFVSLLFSCEEKLEDDECWICMKEIKVRIPNNPNPGGANLGYTEYWKYEGLETHCDSKPRDSKHQRYDCEIK